MNTKNTILPPANGKKLWRVKRASSNEDGDEASQTSMECLKSSLKISAAAAAATAINGKPSGRRPSLKRPKNIPGKPKNFVFVDLSPVKSEEQENDANIQPAIGQHGNSPVQQLPSPQASDRDSQVFDHPIQSDDSFCLSSVDSGSPTFSSNDSMSDITSPELSQTNTLGLGINGIDYLPPDLTPNSESFPTHILSQQLYGYQKAMIQQHYQIQLLQQQLQEQQRKQIQLQNQQLQQELARLAMLSPFPQFQPQMPYPVATPVTTPRETTKVNKKRAEKRKSLDQFKSYSGPKSVRSASDGCIKKVRHNRSSSDYRPASIGTITPPTSAGFTDTPMAVTDSMINVSTFTADNIDPFLMADSGLDTTFSFPAATSFADMVENFDTKDISAALLEECGADPLFGERPEATDYRQFVSM
ncbi:uncharacterized protein SPAPADRAFT_61064 [Spathaspora passalidarum NRRL Y-27907]|uniref:Uncharacterized protein n=1 Tax=Spathaspora passalidarum (strain NRRL Y-27907 / 11-Y1) TaxID=619300 RepID=G3ANG0_SPAPN|nr:uncharacterized protein SPAPADRAFT_61064 [Spathaspora passalidarum NRRL Y-27907]EGW31949.1 hypothetical protein SPAPADRAFT_61064 [Spathaspora passalidarum NRRL Y-27907]